MGKLSGKVAVVTGASKGIGAEIARELAAAGAAVAVNYATSREGADRVVGEIEGNGGKAAAIQGDVAKAEDVARLFAETQRRFGPVGVLVNNAGIYRFGNIDAVLEEDFHQHFNTNVLGVLLAIREGLKHFAPEGGSIVNLGSIVTRLTPPENAVYVATKSAVEGITRVLAKELGPRHIRVNAINPGLVETEGTHATGIIGSDFERQLVQMTPLGRFGQPGDIAPVAVFLASDDARWVTGEVIFAAGGL
jgi:3-oxoacyl-[acyl-carrier protein] reductase